MEVSGKNVDRNKMAVELYFSVLKLRKAEGVSHRDARDLAYDAVELRYNISPKRLQNIISSNHDVLRCDRNMFLDDNTRLIEALRDSNQGMLMHIEENDKLIKMLEEVNNV